jgi:hypothetical protein
MGSQENVGSLRKKKAAGGRLVGNNAGKLVSLYNAL